MADQLQLRGGTTTEHNTFTGASKEVTVDTTKKTAVVHDGSTAGGNPLMREDGANSALALGSQGTPSLKFTGDTNTGIYSPGADQVAISTGGTGRLFVNTNGVGVGSASSFNFQANVDSAGASTYPAAILNNGTTANTEVRMMLMNGGTYPRGAFIGSVLESATGNPHAFVIGTNLAYSAPDERLRITSDGKLGLGTNTPGSYGASADNFVVYENGNAGITIAGGTTGYSSIFFADGTSGAAQYAGSIQYSHGDDKLYIGSGANTTITCDSSQRVGIGATSPGSLGELLHVAGKARFQEAAASGAIAFIGANSTEAYFDTGTYGAPQPIAFKLSGVEKARLDSSGRLLVGTTSEVSSVNPSIQTARSNGGFMAIANSDTVTDADTTLGQIAFYGKQSSVYCPGATITAISDATWSSSSDTPSRLVFATSPDGLSTPTDRMRIGQSGNVRFGTAGTSYGVFDINNDGSSTYKLDYVSSGGSRLFAVQASNGSVVNFTGTYTTVSDVKLKENIVESPSQWQDIKALRVVKYNFKEETGYEQHTQLGLIAQEVEEVSPGLVFDIPDTDADGVDLGTVTKGVKQSIIYMKAVKALQEAMERIEQLEAKVAALEAQ